MAARIRLRTREFENFCDLKGWKTRTQTAEGLKVNVATVSRVLDGKTAPGEQFIAAVLAAFPRMLFADLFEVHTDEAPADADEQVA